MEYTTKTAAGQPVVYITRSESFCAAHRLHNAALTDEKNLAIFGKCNHKNGHGHNYTVEVTLKGKVDEHTGMVINLTDLSAVMKTQILDVLDHKNIDQDVPYFQSVTSTAENIAVFIWSQLAPHLPIGSLYDVKLRETDKNSASFRGEFAV